MTLEIITPAALALGLAAALIYSFFAEKEAKS